MVISMDAGAGDLINAFRKPDFDIAVFIRDATSRGPEGVGRLSQQLEDCAQGIEQDLQREIVSCHEELLHNAGSVDYLDEELAKVRESITALKKGGSQIRADVLMPFKHLKHRVILLQRMQAVNVLVRKLLRFLFDAKKLRSQMESANKDYSKAAHTLHELEAVLQESGLEGVDVLQPEIMWIKQTGAQVRHKAEEDLRAGLRQGNQITLSVALQVFFNLNTLWPQLQATMKELLEGLERAPLGTGGVGFLQSLEAYLILLASHTKQVFALDELLRCKTDALTHQKFSAVLEKNDVESLTHYFWAEAVKNFAAKVNRVAAEKSARRALLNDFPKVLHILLDAVEKINVSGRGRATQILSSSDQEVLHQSVGELRGEYLQESIRRVTEPVELMLPSSLISALNPEGKGTTDSGKNHEEISEELPTSHDVKRYIQMLATELERAEPVPDLLLKDVMRNVRNSIMLFATRLEYLMDSGALDLQCVEDENANPIKLRSPMPMPVAGHARNARIFGIAHHACSALREFIPSRFQSIVVTAQVLSTLQQTQSAVVLPMIQSVQRIVTICIQRMEQWIEKNAKEESPDILVAVQMCNHVSRYYFALFGSGHLQLYLKDLSIYIIRSFLSYAVLVKPCTEVARKVLVTNMQSLELALGALDSEFQNRIRFEASVFKEFRRVFFMEQFEQEQLQDLLNTVPLHLLLVYLLSQLPAAVPQLHVFCGQSAEAFLEATLMPCWQEEDQAIENLKKIVRDVLQKHGRSAGANATIVTFLRDKAS